MWREEIMLVSKIEIKRTSDFYIIFMTFNKVLRDAMSTFEITKQIKNVSPY